MSYATETDMVTHFGSEQVLIASDRDGSGTSDTGVIDAALLKASEEIDSYLINRFNLPLTTTPGVLKGHCCEIAMYRLSSDGAYTDEKRQRYKDSISWLKDVARGLAGLDDESGAQEESNDLVEMSTETTTRQFTRSTLGNVM